jgi:hypothetical protein
MGPGRRRGHQRVEQPRIPALLRMPLHTDREARRATGHLEALDRAVGRPRGGDQAVPELVHGLVVMGRRVQPGIPAGPGQYPAQHPGRGDPDQVTAEPAVRPGVLLVPDHLRQVLVQGAAPDHVEQLDAPADGQQRHLAGQRRDEQSQLPAVPLVVGRAGLRVRAGPVPGRVHVTAAGHDQPVQVGHGRGRLGRVAAGGQQHRPPAAAAHRVHVGLRDQRGRR